MQSTEDIDHDEEFGIVGPQGAAEWLAIHAPSKNAKQWKFWLGSNRQPKRAVRWRMPFLAVGRDVFYVHEDLRRLSRLENAKAQKKTPMQEDLIWMYSLLTQKGKPAT